jgi:hypothetical protein
MNVGDEIQYIENDGPHTYVVTGVAGNCIWYKLKGQPNETDRGPALANWFEKVE